MPLEDGNLINPDFRDAFKVSIGQIVKGEIKIGDIAKKDATSLLVQPAK